ncbi:MAG: zinc-finger domain-containing protein [Gammaproteobacteria bacterium]
MTTENHTHTIPSQYIEANAANLYEVTRADLPLHCPMDSMTLWNSHPRVYLPVEATGRSKCPYCGAVYVLSGAK